MEDITWLFSIIFIIFVFVSEIREKNKEIKTWYNNWQFCKDLLDKEKEKNKQINK